MSKLDRRSRVISYNSPIVTSPVVTLGRQMSSSVLTGTSNQAAAEFDDGNGRRPSGFSNNASSRWVRERGHTESGGVIVSPAEKMIVGFLCDCLVYAIYTLIPRNGPMPMGHFLFSGCLSAVLALCSVFRSRSCERNLAVGYCVT